MHLVVLCYIVTRSPNVEKLKNKENDNLAYSGLIRVDRGYAQCFFEN